MSGASLGVQWLSPPSNRGDTGLILTPRRSHMPWGNWAWAPQLEISPLTATKAWYNQINKYF